MAKSSNYRDLDRGMSRDCEHTAWKTAGRSPHASCRVAMQAMVRAAAVLFLLSQAGRSSEIDFARDVKPILSKHCFACHGPDRSQQSNDLRLDRRQDAAAVLNVATPAESELLRRIATDDATERMPPAGGNRETLTAAEIELLREWIAAGASYTDHWSYQPPQRPAVPDVHDSTWPKNPLDHFVLAKNEARSVRQAPAADRVTLARRVSLDLRGLPPTHDEVNDFLNDGGERAYERFVDHMLASEHFGERLAMVWLDLVRFADTCGYHGDQHREIDAYRDYVIASFNANRPFDQFTIEQLAGDLLPEPSTEQLVASGYNRLLQTTEEGGAQPQEYRAIYNADRVRNVSSVWLGTTLGCAQCHDHKFDPFSLVDFYSLAAFFADVEEVDVGRQPPNLELPTAEQSARLAELQGRLTELQRGAAESQEAGQELETAVKQVETQIAELREGIRKTLITRRVPPRETRVLPRGNWQDGSGLVVEPRVPAIFGQPMPSDRRASRLDLAKWLTADDNPLTARVFVNHLWRLLFARGLVQTPDDFGAQGDYPSHPELLDWLAVEFRESGWNIKHMVRLMALSATYQQSATAQSDDWQRDPQNRWLARQHRYRLEAEIVRDGALAVSGLLNRQVGGRSAKPYQPVGYWDQLNFPKRTYIPDRGEDQYRRGVYTYWCRTFLHPGMVAFDAPSREECTAKRNRSNTPLQALVLLNDPSFVEAARGLAARTLQESAATDDRSRARWMWSQVLSRAPHEDEVSVLEQVVIEQRAVYEHDSAAAEALLKVGQGTVPQEGDMPPAELAAWTAAARVLLNLHETITRP